MDPYTRYVFLKNAIRELESDLSPRTFGWFIVNYNFLKEIYDAFEDLEKVEPDFDSDWFRSCCRDLNNLLYKLLNEYRNNQWFDLESYKQFCCILLKVIDYAHSVNEKGDELSDMLGSIMCLSGETN